MKQLLRKGLKNIVVDEVPDPVVTPHHVIVRPHYSLISSGTETASIHRGGAVEAVAENPSYIGKILDVMKTEGPVRTTREVLAKLSEYAVLGYSGAGVVIDKHSAVSEFEIGDRVAYGGEGTGHAEAILVGRNLVVKVPDNVPFEHACFTTLGSIALNAVRIANISLGERVAVIGLGTSRAVDLPVGAPPGWIRDRHRPQGGPRGAARQPRRGRRSRRRSGASATVSSLTGGLGVDCAIIAAAAKSDAPCRLAVEICRDRGRIVDVGAVELNFPWYESYLKEIQVYMARAYGPGSYDASYERLGQDYPLPYVRWTEKRNMEEFLRLAAQGRLQIEGLITHRFPLEDAPKAYEVIMDPIASSLAVLLKYPAIETATPVAEPQPDAGLKSIVDRQPPLKLASHSSEQAIWLDGSICRISRKLPECACARFNPAAVLAQRVTPCVLARSIAPLDYEEILGNPAIQVVVVVSRNQQHAAQALAALRAGKHVFVEKPMALTEEECRALSSRAGIRKAAHGRIQSTLRSQLYSAERTNLETDGAGRAQLPCQLSGHFRIVLDGRSRHRWRDSRRGLSFRGSHVLAARLRTDPRCSPPRFLPTGKIRSAKTIWSPAFPSRMVPSPSLTYCTVGSRTSGGERVEAFAPGIGVSAENFSNPSFAPTCPQALDLVRGKRLRSSDAGFLHRPSARQVCRTSPCATVYVRPSGACVCCSPRANTSPCPIDLDEFLRIGPQ